MVLTKKDVHLTNHAREHMSRRVGIFSEDEAKTWIVAHVNSAERTKKVGDKTHYIRGNLSAVLAGNNVITVQPTTESNEYLTKFSDYLTKKTERLLSHYERELRKADIKVTETRLNFLKARNPNTKSVISERLAEATRIRAEIQIEIDQIEYAAMKFKI